MNNYNSTDNFVYKNLRNKKQSELKTFFKLFIEDIEIRMKQLHRVVNKNQFYVSLDYSKDSLIFLGKWFYGQAELQKTRIDIYQDSNRYENIEAPEWELTERSLSLSVDIGIYMGKIFIEHYPQLRWGQILNDKTFVDYGQPLIVGFAKTTLNPVRIATVLALQFAQDSKDGLRLRELFSTWEKHI